MKNKSLRFMALSLAAVMALSDASIVTAAQTDTAEEIVYEGATDVDDEYLVNPDAEADVAEADLDGEVPGPNENGSGTDHGGTAQNEEGSGQTPQTNPTSGGGDEGGTGAGGTQNGQNQEGDVPVTAPVDSQTETTLPVIAESFAEVSTATLHDTAEKIEDADLYSAGTYSATAVAEDSVIKATLTASKLRNHRNGQGNEGYWIGIGMPAVAPGTEGYGITKVGYLAGYGQLPEDYQTKAYNPLSAEDFETDGKVNMYFNAESALDQTEDMGQAYFVFKYENEAEEASFIPYLIDMSATTLNSNLPDASAMATIADGIITATLTDNNPAEDKALASLYEENSYTASAAVDGADPSQINVSVGAEGLMYHYDGEAVPKGGFWAGIAIPVAEGVETQYLQSYTEVTDFEAVTFKDGLDSVYYDTAGNKTHDTVYFNVKKADLADNTGYVYAKYTDKEDASKTRIVTYKIDFSGVETETTASSLAAQMNSITIAAPAEGSELVTKDVEVYVDPEASRVILSAESSNSAVATAQLSADQKVLTVKGLSVGEAEITVTDEITKLAAVVKVNVGGEAQAVDSINIKSAPAIMGVGEKGKVEYTVYPANYTDSQIIISSNNEKVIHVDQEGNIYALAQGKADVTVSVAGKEATPKLIDQCTIIVKPEADILSIDKTSVKLNAPVNGKDDVGADIVLKAAGTAKVRATVAPANAYTTAVTWSIDDSTVAGVDENGVITAKAAGNAVVTATLTRSDGSTIKRYVNVEVTSIDEEDQPLYKKDALWIGKVYPVSYYDGIKQTPMPNVYYDSTLLTYGTDYTITYSNNVNAHEGNEKDKKSPRLTVNFKGNYTGTLSEVFTITPANVTYMDIQTISAPVRTDKKTKEPVKQDKLKPVIMTWSGKALKEGRDYELKYNDTREGAYTTAGDWTITVEGKGNYADSAVTGTAIMHLGEVSDGVIDIAKAEIKGLEKTYKYREFNPQISIEGLVEGTDYTVQYNGAYKIGKASVTITGISDKCYGTKTVKFSIVKNPVDLKADEGFSVTIDDNDVGFKKVEGTEDEYVQAPAKENVVVVYEKSGVKPNIGVSYYGSPLSSSMKISNKVDLKSMSGKVTVQGDGNYYKGVAEVEYTIAKQNLENLTIVVDDPAESAKSGAYKKNAVKIYDVSGKELKEGTDYTLDWTGNSDTPKAGDTITVKVEGKGYYTGTVELSATVVAPESKLGSGKSLKNYKYCGSAVEPSAENFNIYAGKGKTAKKLTAGTDFEVAGYINNNKAGLATAIVKGKGAYSGTVLVNFRIKNK